jgi:hypothetical protein
MTLAELPREEWRGSFFAVWIFIKSPYYTDAPEREEANRGIFVVLDRVAKPSFQYSDFRGEPSALLRGGAAALIENVW